MAGKVVIVTLSWLFLLLSFLCSAVYASYDLPYKIPGPRRLNDKIAIVGAGPAGVHMALLLKQKGFKNVEILEKTSRIGGKSRSISYRGAVHEMGTVYISPDYTSIHKLLETYLPNDMVPFPSASIWKDNLPAPINFSMYAAQYVMREVLFKKATGKEVVKEIVEAMMIYEKLHVQILGKYDGEIMPEPNTENMFKLRGTFMDFIERNKLKALVPIFQVSMTMQGYGHLDEVAALYGLMWNTPKFINGFRQRLNRDGDGGMKILKSGFQRLWEAIVRKENLQVTFNTDIYKVYRPITRRYTREGKLVRSRCTPVWICKRVRGRNWDMPVWERYDFLVWSPEMKTTMHLWKDQTDIEQELFSSTTPVYFTTAMLDSQNMLRGQSPIDYWMDNMVKKREHSVWAQRNSYGVVNQLHGRDYQKEGVLSTGNDGNKKKKTTVTYQMSNQPTTKAAMQKTLLKHFASINGTDMYVQNLKIWRYFPRYSPAQMEKGVLWRILEQQGKFNMWYIGSSVCFESVKSVVEYNKLVVHNMETPSAN